MKSSLIPLKTVKEVQLELADKVKALRLQNNWSRDTLASRAGISPASLKRFENSGEASLSLLLKVSFVLSRLQEFDVLLQPPAATTMKELEDQLERPLRKRGMN